MLVYFPGNAERINNLGLAWVHLGLLRFHLLLNLDCPDPAMKYSFKHSQIVERISMLELEIKVHKFYAGYQCSKIGFTRLDFWTFSWLLMYAL